MSSKNNVCFFNGESANSVPVDDRGLSYGHGLFETIRLSNGSAPLWNYHFSRLTGDAAKLGIKIDGHLLQGYFEQLIMACPADGVIKVIVTAGSGGRGYRSSSLHPNYLLQWFPLSDYPVSHQTLGIALKHCQHPLPHSPQLAGIKHLNRFGSDRCTIGVGGSIPRGADVRSAGQCSRSSKQQFIFLSRRRMAHAQIGSMWCERCYASVSNGRVNDGTVDRAVNETAIAEFFQSS